MHLGQVLRELDHVIHFWFSVKSEDWFQSQSARSKDRDIRDLFLPLLQSVYNNDGLCMAIIQHRGRGRRTMKYLLALIIVLDQFPRHIYRSTGRAYEHDAYACKVLRHGLREFSEYYECEAKDVPMNLRRPWQRVFLLLPFQHSTRKSDQKRGLEIWRHLVCSEKDEQNLGVMIVAMKHQLGHLQVLRRFGGFPKRKAPENRTEEEERHAQDTSVPY